MLAHSLALLLLINNEETFVVSLIGYRLHCIPVTPYLLYYITSWAIFLQALSNEMVSDSPARRFMLLCFYSRKFDLDRLNLLKVTGVIFLIFHYSY